MAPWARDLLAHGAFVNNIIVCYNSLIDYDILEMNESTYLCSYIRYLIPH